MIRFLQPEWLWLLTLLPLVMLLRGRRGPVAAIEFSDVGLAREVARSSRARRRSIPMSESSDTRLRTWASRNQTAK